MDSQQTFFVLAGGLVALVLAAILPSVWRGVRLQPANAAARAAARRQAWLITGLLVSGLPLVALGSYALRGDPGALGAERGVLSEQLLHEGLPAQGQASTQLQAELERHLQMQPRDARAWVLKARLDMRSQQYGAAVAAFERAVAGKSKAANDAGVWVEYAEARGMAQGGTLLGEPQQLVQKALAIDARHAQALDLAGSAAWEGRDYASAVLYWNRLLAQLKPGQTRHAELTAAIARAQRLARLSLPASP